MRESIIILSLYWDTIALHESCLNKLQKRVLFQRQTYFSVCIPFESTYKRVSHFLIMELLLSKKSQLLSLQMKNKTFLWAGLICPLGRHLKFLLDKATHIPLPLLAVIVEVHGVEACAKYVSLKYLLNITAELSFSAFQNSCSFSYAVFFLLKKLLNAINNYNATNTISLDFLGLLQS